MAITPGPLDGRARGPARAALRGLLSACAVAQLGFFAWSVAPGLARASADVDLFVADEPREFAYPAIWAYRSLPPLARRIPLDARTLLLSMVIDPVPYEFYFVPRPFHLLQWFPPETVDLAAQRAPEHAHLFAERLRQMQDRRILYGPERLAEELSWCEFAVVFAPNGAAVPDLTPLELVAQEGPASLYRVPPK